MQTRKIKGYGWRRDSPDHRDLLGVVPVVKELPPLVDLRPLCPPVYDQGNLGSCTANAIAAAIEFEIMKSKAMPDFKPSRLFIYYNERVIEGDVDQDGGAQIRDGIKSVASQGVCGEGTGDGEWPYNVDLFAVKPPEAAYMNAQTYEAFQTGKVKYLRVAPDLNDMKQTLAAGYPFVFGFSVYPEFESAEVGMTGVVPMPGPDEAPIGGHAVMCVGYDEDKQVFLVRNSWGANWGIAGYFYLPYAYMGQADDFWVIKLGA